MTNKLRFQSKHIQNPHTSQATFLWDPRAQSSTLQVVKVWLVFVCVFVVRVFWCRCSTVLVFTLSRVISVSWCWLFLVTDLLIYLATYSQLIIADLPWYLFIYVSIKLSMPESVIRIFHFPFSLSIILLSLANICCDIDYVGFCTHISHCPPILVDVLSVIPLLYHDIYYA